MSRHAADHAECHRDIDLLLAEIERLRTVLAMCAEAGHEAGQVLLYRPEKIAHSDGSTDASREPR